MKKKMKNVVILDFVILCCLFACKKDKIDPYGSYIEYDYIPLINDSIPPCLEGLVEEVVIKNQDDYSTVRKTYAPQGKYENFTGDGTRTSFKLSYQPLDIDDNGEIDPNELIIYVKEKPITINYNNKEITVSSDPFQFENDSILIFDEDNSNNVIDIIPYTAVFQINAENGEITFNSPPPSGSDIWLCGVKRLYDNYNDRDCNYEDIDLTDKIIVGNSIEGDGCLLGFDIQLLVDSTQKIIIYKSKVKIQNSPFGCSEIALSYTKWILIDNIQEDYTVKFGYDTLWVY